MTRIVLLIYVLAGSSSVLAQGRVSRVAVSRVVRQQVDSRQSYIGSVIASRSSSVGSAVDGRVVVLHVNEGDFVRKGDPLAQLLTETIDLELEAAQAEADLRKQELAELENGARPEELAGAKARMLAAKAFQAFRAAQKHRSDELFRKGAINEDEHNEAVAEADSAEQLFRAAEENWKLVTAGPRAEKIAQARARFAQQNAIVRNLESRIQKHTIKAPYDGYVVAEHTEAGEWIKQGELVADVIALSRVDVLVHVLEKHIAHIRRGMTVDVTIPALPDHSFQGRIVHIVPQADARARTFPVKVQVENSIRDNDPLIKSGMLARASLPTGPARQTVLIPKDALVLGGKSPVVFVIDVTKNGNANGKTTRANGGAGSLKAETTGEGDSGTVREATVALGESHGGLIAITSQLRPGELVVVRGNERLRTGSEVVITEVLKPDAAPRVESRKR